MEVGEDMSCGEGPSAAAPTPQCLPRLPCLLHYLDGRERKACQLRFPSIAGHDFNYDYCSGHGHAYNGFGSDHTLVDLQDPPLPIDSPLVSITNL